MAPLPVSLEVQEVGPLGPGTEYNFPSRPGMPMPRPHPSPAGAPDVDDVFVVAVSLVVVASLTVFVVYQAIGALKEMIDTRPSPFSALSISSFRKHGWNSLTSTESEQMQLLCPSAVSIDTEGCRRNSRWVGEHRCQFTLSPDPYDSDTSSTLTRSSSDSTVVGGRICVVYDDTIEPSDEDEEEDGEGEESDSEEEEVPEEKVQYRRPMYEPRTRVRRQAIFST